MINANEIKRTEIDRILDIYIFYEISKEFDFEY